MEVYCTDLPSSVKHPITYSAYFLLKVPPRQFNLINLGGRNESRKELRENMCLRTGEIRNVQKIRGGISPSPSLLKEVEIVTITPPYFFKVKKVD
jgi:hypothetical protein